MGRHKGDNRGWTDERRAQQSRWIGLWRPWDYSTGPRTEEGKQRSARNVYGDATDEEIAARKRTCEVRSWRVTIRMMLYGWGDETPDMKAFNDGLRTDLRSGWLPEHLRDDHYCGPEKSAVPLDDDSGINT